VLGFVGWTVSHVMANRLIGLGFADFLGNLAAPLVAALLLTLLLSVAGLGLRLLLPGATALRLLAGSCLALLLYGLILGLVAPGLLKELRQAAREAAGR
jgi:hypothetical protein